MCVAQQIGVALSFTYDDRTYVRYDITIMLGASFAVCAPQMYHSRTFIISLNEIGILLCVVETLSYTYELHGMDIMRDEG